MCKPYKRQGSERLDRQKFSQTRDLEINKEKINESA